MTSFDGARIVYSFFPVPGSGPAHRAPTVMFGPGYSSAWANSSDPTVAALLNAGYNVLTWDSRGFGDSDGNVEIDSPQYEGRDVQALIDYIVRRPEAMLDAPGDPRLGMVGASYGGGIQLVSAAIDRRIDVIAPCRVCGSMRTRAAHARAAGATPSASSVRGAGTCARSPARRLPSAVVARAATGAAMPGFAAASPTGASTALARAGAGIARRPRGCASRRGSGGRASRAERER